MVYNDGGVVGKVEKKNGHRIQKLHLGAEVELNANGFNRCKDTAFINELCLLFRYDHVTNLTIKIFQKNNKIRFINVRFYGYSQFFISNLILAG